VHVLTGAAPRCAQHLQSEARDGRSRPDDPDQRARARGGTALEPRLEGGLDSVEQERLHRLQLALDQTYDLLNQRRARRNAGLDPDDARARPVDVVESYEQ
jgi:hypothetical protein